MILQKARVKLARAGCRYAMHTNFDVGDMGLDAAKRLSMRGNEILEVTGEADTGTLGIGVKGEFPETMTLLEAAELVNRLLVFYMSVYLAKRSIW